jgi:glycosyltransferase involved in cell wall biosynthesis
MTSLAWGAAAASGLWLLLVAYWLWTLSRLPRFGEETARLAFDDFSWPALSVIVPACNEARRIEAALASLSAQDYPGLEILAIDDRSTDATGEILERLAMRDARIRVLHVQALPKDWLGKVHALHQGAQRARGDWWLFTDADVRYRPAMLRRAIRYAESQGVDHLVCLPEVHAEGLWLDVAARAFLLLLCVGTRLALVNAPGSRTPIGIGAFNLVRAETFRRTPGFEWLRMETVDDYGLGVMVKEAGGRTRLVRADDDLSVTWYESLGAMVRGLEKNSFGAVAGYSWARVAYALTLVWGLVAAPPAALAVGWTQSAPLVLGAGLAPFAAIAVFALFAPRRRARDVVAWLLAPPGIAIIGWMMLRSAWLCTRHGGIDWRGTHYPLEALRRGQRVRF